MMRSLSLFAVVLATLVAVSSAEAGPNRCRSSRQCQPCSSGCGTMAGGCGWSSNCGWSQPYASPCCQNIAPCGGCQPCGQMAVGCGGCQSCARPCVSCQSCCNQPCAQGCCRPNVGCGMRRCAMPCNNCVACNGCAMPCNGCQTAGCNGCQSGMMTVMARPCGDGVIQVTLTQAGAPVTVTGTVTTTANPTAAGEQAVNVTAASVQPCGYVVVNQQPCGSPCWSSCGSPCVQPCGAWNGCGPRWTTVQSGCWQRSNGCGGCGGCR